MHEINFLHKHEITDGDFGNCCKDCQTSVEIIKPHILHFAGRIKKYTPKMLGALHPDELYRRYQILDDLAHMETGAHLADLVLKDPDIRKNLGVIRSYYTTFFSIHETNLARELIASTDPWKLIKSFPLYPRYKALVKNHLEDISNRDEIRLVFIGCGPVPMTLILMNQLYGIKSVGLESSRAGFNLSKKVIEHLGLGEDISIMNRDDNSLSSIPWNMALVAALAEPKGRIFKNLRLALKGREKSPVIFRSYTEMREVLYQSVKPEKLEGFRIVKEILPTGRVNNTTYIAELVQ